MKIKLLLTLLTLIFTLSSASFAQKARIETNEKSLITIISAVSNDEVFTENGNLKFSEIKEVLFEVYDSKFLSLYTKLQVKVPVKFGDGTDLGQAIKDPIPMVINDLSSYSDSYPEDFLIKGSKSALTGMGLIGLGSILGILGASSEGGEASIVGGVLGVVGVGFIADGWSKIGKAGKAMKAEKAKKNKSN